MPSTVVATLETRPLGFEGWAEFALQHGSKHIDDYDRLERDLKPYRSPAAAEAFRLMNADIPRFHEWEIQRIRIVDGHLNDSLQEPSRTYFRYMPEMIKPFAHRLPNNSVFFFQTADEPSVIRGPAPPSSAVAYKDRADRSDLAEILARACQYTPAEVSKGLLKEQDFCKIKDVHLKHGLAASPWRLISTYSVSRLNKSWSEGESMLTNERLKLLPALSIGRTTAHMDILLPCPCYWETTIYDAPAKPWSQKQPKIYWRGRNSDSVPRAGAKGMKYGHRHRMLAYVNGLSTLEAPTFDNCSLKCPDGKSIGSHVTA